MWSCYDFPFILPFAKWDLKTQGTLLLAKKHIYPQAVQGPSTPLSSAQRSPQTWCVTHAHDWSQWPDPPVVSPNAKSSLAPAASEMDLRAQFSTDLHYHRNDNNNNRGHHVLRTYYAPGTIGTWSITQKRTAKLASPFYSNHFTHPSKVQ